MKYSYKVFIFIWTIILLFFLLYFGYSEISENEQMPVITIRNTTKAKHNKNRYPKMFKNRNNYMHKQPYDFHAYPTSFGQ